MDTPVIISLIVLLIIAGIEIFCLFLCRRSPQRPPLTLAVPVFADKELLTGTLSRVRELLLRGSCPLDAVILINYGADSELNAICEEFCRDFREAVFLKPEEVENFLAETFAFAPEM